MKGWLAGCGWLASRDQAGSEPKMMGLYWINERNRIVFGRVPGRASERDPGWLADWLAGWPAGWLAAAGWLAGRLAAWLASRLAAGWLAGRLA